MASVVNFLSAQFSNAHHAIQKMVDPEYEKITQKLFDLSQRAETISFGVTVFSGLGVLVSVTQRSVAGMIASLVLGYFSYNIYRVSQNGKEIAQNPKLYTVLQASALNVVKESFDAQKLRDKFRENTIGFDFVVEEIVSILTRPDLPRRL